MRRAAMFAAFVSIVTAAPPSIALASARPAYLASHNLAGRAGDGSSGGNGFLPGVSANGRFVGFASDASDLVAGDNNSVRDVFVADTWLRRTTRVSVDPFGREVFRPSGSLAVAISDDGRFVAFESLARLVEQDANSFWDVYVRDTLLGLTLLASAPISGVADAGSLRPSISANGRFVGLESDATNLVDGDTNAATDVFRFDTLTGKMLRASLRDDGQQGTAPSPTRPDSTMGSISADGSRMAFRSAAVDLVAGDTNDVADVFVRDLSGSGSTIRASVAASGLQANGASQLPSISGDGAVVAFESSASNLTPGDANATFDVFARTLGSSPATILVSAATGGGAANGISILGRVNPSGTSVAFRSSATNVIAGDTNVCAGYPLPGSCPDVFVFSLVSALTFRVSDPDGLVQANGESYAGVVSADGSVVVFSSAASNVVSGDANGVSDIFGRTIDGPCASGSGEDGPLTNAVHESVEPQLGPLAPLVHNANCFIAPAGV